MSRIEIKIHDYVSLNKAILFFKKTRPDGSSKSVSLRFICEDSSRTYMTKRTFSSLTASIETTAWIVKSATVDEDLLARSLEAHSIDRFCEALVRGGLTHLIWFGAKCTPKRGANTVQRLAHLLRSSRALTFLHCFDVDFSGSLSYLPEMTDALSLCPLEFIDFFYSRNGIALLMPSAFEGCQHLRYLNLTLEWCDHHCNQLAKVVQACQYLSHLHICINKNKQHSTQLLFALRNSKSIRHLAFHFEYGVPFFSEKIQESFVSMLKENTTITNLRIGDLTTDKLTSNSDLPKSFVDMAHYVKMNTWGRKLLREYTNTSRKDWVDVLIKGRDDVATMYEMLLMNPTLCHVQPESQNAHVFLNESALMEKCTSKRRRLTATAYQRGANA